MNTLMSREQLEERVGTPPGIILAKTVHHLDAGALSWLAASTIMLASISTSDDINVVLGGGGPGWAGGNKTTLCLPVDALDAPDSITPGSGFGSVFLVPSIKEMMRVNGRVTSNDGIEIRVAVEECYIHCGKALIRSDFWSASLDASDDLSIEYLIAHCRFMGLATCDPYSNSDLSPKGDPAGLMVKVDDGTLRFADRPGNRRIDSFRNIVAQPRIAAVLLVPGSHQVAVIKGTARITDDTPERERFAVGERVPELVTVVTDIIIDRRDSKALGRASWPAPLAPAGLSAGRIAAGHLKLSKGVGAKLAGVVMSVPGLVERELAKDYKKNLY